jgi:hypothetical protein
MNRITKKIVIVIIIVIVIVGLYFGAYLPYKKAHAFILKIRQLQSVGSIEELTFNLSEVLDIPSPVGRDEVVGFTLDQLSNIVRGDFSKEINHSLADYAEEISAPVLDNPRSAELTKTILKMGIIYQKIWFFHKEPVYAAKAETLYLKGLEISPNRPQFLYGLFDLYLSGGRVEDAKQIGEKIIGFWPNDSVTWEKLRLLGALQ